MRNVGRMSYSRSSKHTRQNWAHVTRRWLNVGLDLAFPPECAACYAPLESASAVALCATCREQFVDSHVACRRCGIRLPAGLSMDACSHCRDARLHFTRVLRLGTYEGALRAAVLRTKRPQERALAAALGDLLVDVRAEEIRNYRPDVVIPVPMHWTRRVWRGTNSPQTIAARIATLLGVPMAVDLLVRRRRTAPQATLAPHKRRANVRGAFRVRPHYDLPGATILLIDDIMTTGATLNASAKALAEAGAAEITVAVLARAEEPS